MKLELRVDEVVEPLTKFEPHLPNLGIETTARPSGHGLDDPTFGYAATGAFLDHSLLFLKQRREARDPSFDFDEASLRDLIGSGARLVRMS
jgi:hypothetical protein